MEFSNKIVIRQNPNVRISQILQLYSSLIKGDWYPYDENGYVHFSINNEEIQSMPAENEGISKQLAEVEKAQENSLPISIQFLNKINKRNVTLIHEEDQYIFHLEVRNSDDKYELFKEFHLSLKKSFPEKFHQNKIEWRSNQIEEIIRLETDLYHEGVLILASSNRLRKHYMSNEFNYDFPKGLEELLQSNSIIAIHANDVGFETVIDFDNIEDNRNAITSNLYVEGKSLKLNIHFEGKDDELLLLSYADFTMICKYHKGNYKNYGWKHIISIPMELNKKEGFKIWKEPSERNFKLIFALHHSESIPVKNELIYIETIPTNNKS